MGREHTCVVHKLSHAWPTCRGEMLPGVARLPRSCSPSHRRAPPPYTLSLPRGVSVKAYPINQSYLLAFLSALYTCCMSGIIATRHSTCPRWSEVIVLLLSQLYNDFYCGPPTCKLNNWFCTGAWSLILPRCKYFFSWVLRYFNCERHSQEVTKKKDDYQPSAD